MLLVVPLVRSLAPYLQLSTIIIDPNEGHVNSPGNIIRARDQHQGDESKYSTEFPHPYPMSSSDTFGVSTSYSKSLWMKYLQRIGPARGRKAPTTFLEDANAAVAVAAFPGKASIIYV